MREPGTENSPVPTEGENLAAATSQNRKTVDASIPGGVVPLESILCTEELHRRPPRPPNYEKENRALVALSHALADSPRIILQTLADTILEVCEVDSAGISLLTTHDGGKRFYWPAIAGRWKPHIGGGTPRDFGPCGDVLDRNIPLLFRHPECRYTYFQPMTPPVEECLLIPFYAEGVPVGTIWAIAHDDRRKFDAEDERLMCSLGNFASSAYQVVTSLDALKFEVAEREKAERELRRSDTALRNFVETAPIGLNWVGADGIILWANKAELELLGYAREEYIGHNIAEFYADEGALSDILGRLSRGEALQEYETRLRCKDSSTRHVLIDSSVLFEDGKFVHNRCFTRDITKRKKAETQLRESELRFRKMINVLPAAVYTTDTEGRLTHFNPAAVELSGRVPDLGTDRWHVGWKLFRADGTPLPHDQCGMAVAIKEGGIVDWPEVIAERPDGKRVSFTPYPRLLRDTNGRIVGGINILVDITERKEAERSTALLAAIVNFSDDAIVSKNLDGVITSWNKAAERMFGYTAEEAVGRNITLIIPPDRQDEEAMILERLKRGEPFEHFETIRVRKDGTSLDVSLTISPVKDSAGRVVGASKVARDISGQKKADVMLRESEEQLRNLAGSLETQVQARTEELEQRNTEVLKQAQELRELSQRLMHSQDEERRHLARELHDSVGQMVTSLGMDLAIIVQHGRQSLPQLVVAAEDAQRLVRQLSQEIRTVSYLLHPPMLDELGLPGALRLYAQGLGERGLTVSLSIPKDFGRLSREMEMVIFRIVQECLTNVHRHSGSTKAVVRLVRESENVSLEVEDEGKGIAAEKLNEIRSQGSGVGITGMRERIGQLGGAMTIESRSVGTKMSFKFPLLKTAP
jgi:PAS domain S-box-containing protein